MAKFSKGYLGGSMEEKPKAQPMGGEHEEPDGDEDRKSVV